MNLHSINRNCAELGRCFAGFLTIALLVLIPIRSLAGSEAASQESYVKTCLNHFVNQISADGRLTESEYDKLLGNLSAADGIFSVEIMITCHLKAVDEKTGSEAGNYEYDSDIYDVRYTDEVLEQLENVGECIIRDNEMITVKLVCIKESAASRISHLFSGDAGNGKEFVAGWKR